MIDDTIKKIARDFLSVHSFDAKGSDSTDFASVSIVAVGAALKAAYEAGTSSVVKEHSVPVLFQPTNETFNKRMRELSGIPHRKNFT